MTRRETEELLRSTRKVCVDALRQLRELRQAEADLVQQIRLAAETIRDSRRILDAWREAEL